MPIQDIESIPTRDHIKSAVAAGATDIIQEMIDNSVFKRKIRKVAEIDTDNHTIKFVVTADNVDRDGERVLPSALKKDIGYYESNPVVLWNHDHSQPAVAKMIDYEIGKTQVVMTDQFAVGKDIDYPEAKVLWELYSNGYMAMTSIGFIPISVSDEKLEGQTGVTFDRIELIEHSFVNVGANRYANSQLPEKIRTDTTLKSAYAGLVEQPPLITHIGDPNVLKRYMEDTENPLYTPQTFTDNKTTSIHVPSEHSERPLILHLTVPEAPTLTDQPSPSKEVTENMKEDEKRCPKCETEKSKETKRIKGESLSTALADMLNDVDNNDNLIPRLSEATGLTPDAVKDMFAGDYEHPTKAQLIDIAKELGIAADTLIKTAEDDGCVFADDASETDSESADKSISTPDSKVKDAILKKMYGSIPGTYEHRLSVIRRGLYDYLDENLEMEDADDDYYYMDFEIVGTTDKDVVVYCWNTGEYYKADYTITDTQASFSNLMAVMPNVTYTPTETGMGDDDNDDNEM